MKEDEHKRIWNVVTASSPASRCWYCNEPTPVNFCKFADMGDGLGIMRLWCFCDEKCVDKFKKEVADL